MEKGVKKRTQCDYSQAFKISVVREVEQKVRQLEQQKASLEQQLEFQREKAIIFDMMIDVAEEEFKIPMRKKLCPDSLEWYPCATHICHRERPFECNPQENQYRQHPLDYIETLEGAIKEALSVARGYSRAGEGSGIRYDEVYAGTD